MARESGFHKEKHLQKISNGVLAVREVKREKVEDVHIEGEKDQGEITGDGKLNPGAPTVSIPLS